MKIGIIGTGYVGLVTGACLSDFGMEIHCLDKDRKKIDMLKVGKIPIYEPGLEDLVKRNSYYKRLFFTTDYKELVHKCDVIFIGVGTPSEEDGSVNMEYVKEVAREIACHMESYKVIVNKSTVPVTSGRLVKAIIKEVLTERNADIEFDVVSNPEFLREGSAVYDFTHPDRVVIGAESVKALDIMKNVYKVLYLNETPFIETNLETAELIKYASNAFLAIKITFINEFANLCDRVGANVQDIAKAIGRDGRIGPKFLHPGPGFGGSCFPKDTRALAKIGREYQSPLGLVEKTIEANERQKKYMVEKIQNALGDITGLQFAVLGLSFKQNTDDIRESAAIAIVRELLKLGASIRVYDPAAMENARTALCDMRDQIVFCENEYDTFINSDALVILTEWNQFRNLNLLRVKEEIKTRFLFDFRNIYSRAVESCGISYVGLGQ
ncbi:MAG: UDP-glucose/GDP-mannose dehydrogenase family protein [Clostridia bacterium]|nr:UDP-glucose/GDP-mannose dehydrogenase family protein [Clostridia bacterium]